jgi:LCP family protein required for cell wall assembly
MIVKKNKKEKTSRWKIALVILESTLILCYLVITVFYVWIQNDKMGFVKTFSKSAFVRMYLSNTVEQEYEEKVQDTNFNKENITTNKEVSEQIETYRNIALFGIDSRDETFDKSVHSDTIIVVSINNKTGEVKMASVYRDTMLKMSDRDGDDTYTKANAAFFMGGAENAINMLNVNLDLNITDYAVVNFTGLTKIIDALGGIDVNITPQEKFYINGYLVETREITGLDAPDVTESGYVHLSGLQATAYCRIRYVTFTDDDGTEYNNDMGRTARQRSVIKKLVAKAKLAGASEVMAVANEILNYGTEAEKIITTSLSFDEIMDLIPVMLDFELTETFGFPYTYDTPEINGASMVVPCGLSYSVTKLHEELFGEEDYIPSLQVQEISDYIVDYTGIDTVLLEEDETEPEGKEESNEEESEEEDETESETAEESEEE